MKSKKLSIIIPVYNGENYIKSICKQLNNQTYKDFELIIVDDCSTDTSVETVKEYQKEDKRIHLIENKRKRYNGGSRNVGIEYALENINFDYFAMLDSDDWWKDENVLQKRDSLSVFGYEDLGFWKGRTLECESIIDDLEELLK